MTEPLTFFDPDDPEAIACYRGAIRVLRGAGVEFLVGGAYSFARYTGIVRHTKDLDVFLREADVPRALAALAAAGYRTEVTYSHWLAKAFREHHYIDLIYGSGNGAVPVDDGWFAHAMHGEVFGEPVKLCPPEESVWSKAFIMERHRFDGADINHLIQAYGHRMDWRRLLDRFGP
ncbi:MAG: nucleotidyltransferase, partial [Zavarzinella sp.]|nr:nucleotidyltransferase [Zavarzinella sp.]